MGAEAPPPKTEVIVFGPLFFRKGSISKFTKTNSIQFFHIASGALSGLGASPQA